MGHLITVTILLRLGHYLSGYRFNTTCKCSNPNPWFAAYVQPIKEPELKLATLTMLTNSFSRKLQFPRFPRGIESNELWNRFSRPWKSIEFGQNVHDVLKKCRNSKFSHLFIQILFFNADGSSADVFLYCVPWIKFLKNEATFMVLKSFSLASKKYRKWFMKMCGNPDCRSQEKSNWLCFN